MASITFVTLRIEGVSQIVTNVMDESDASIQIHGLGQAVIDRHSALPPHTGGSAVVYQCPINQRLQLSLLLLLLLSIRHHLAIHSHLRHVGGHGRWK